MTIQKEKQLLGKDYLSEEEVNYVVTTVVEDTKKARSNIKFGNANLNDYALLGIKLEDYQLEAVNALNRINLGSTDFSDYEKLDFGFSQDDVDLKELALRIKQERASLGHYLSKDEITSLIIF